MGREPATDTKIVDSDASDTGKVRDEQEEGENNKVIYSEHLGGQRSDSV